jgi:site-specific recombinase XerD
MDGQSNQLTALGDLLRHTYLTWLYGRTKGLRLVQEVAGHTDISMTQICTHISGEDVRQAMQEIRPSMMTAPPAPYALPGSSRPSHSKR